ncbi:autotransporter domain-containing protein [Thioalkalivibrio sp. HK1]|uniref:autotransporter domain-containing protein n=1 Tax=Thioalkalivibrio sp. HK1 TaxID=1469245 RepID=UPI000471DCB8|nr:autotransporter domain-containing protein [Thioalkalivibrio sp. HK1]
MRRLGNTLIVAWMISGAALSSVGADERRFDNIIVIGDSLSDSGTFGGPITDFDPRDGQTSHPGEIAEIFGLPMIPNVALPGLPSGGTNYAQGGARVAGPLPDNTRIPTGNPALSLEGQMQNLLEDRNGNLSEKDLVIVWGGANDLRDRLADLGRAAVQAQAVSAETYASAIAGGASEADATAAASAAANRILDEARATAATRLSAAADTYAAIINRLRQAGATNIIAITAPDVIRTPDFNDQIAGLSDEGKAQQIAGARSLSDLFNNAWRAQTGDRASVMDAGATLDHLLENASRYGMTWDPQDQTLNVCNQRDADGNIAIGGCAPPPAGADRTLPFADGIHPSAMLHGTFAQMIAGTIVGVTQLGGMPATLMAELRQRHIDLDHRLNPSSMSMRDEQGDMRERPPGDVEIHGGADIAFFGQDPGQVMPGFESRTRGFNIAADTMFSTDTMLGAGLSFGQSLTEYDEDRGDFDAFIITGSVFGITKLSSNIYAKGLIEGGLIDIHGIERKVAVNSVVDRYDADTGGSHFSAKAGLGASFAFGSGLTLDPHIDFTFERVSLDGFTESAFGASNPNLAATLGDMRYETSRLSLGLSGLFSPSSMSDWMIRVRGSFEQDFGDDDIVVPFATTGPLVSHRVPHLDDRFGLLSVSLRRQLTAPDASLSFHGSTLVGSKGSSGFTFGLEYRHGF